ncbi:hypothetical protein C8Q79DRAFT_930230 [Trametes meyenii]|nr:hypothetical protein C8Q79DRAFT_930230 [Trametes meyenii]
MAHQQDENGDISAAPTRGKQGGMGDVRPYKHTSTHIATVPSKSRQLADHPRKVPKRARIDSVQANSELAPASSILFPVEIWGIILEYLATINTRSHIAALTRLCARVRYEAEAVLYHAPTVATTAAVVSFAKTVAKCERRARAVRELSVQPHGHISDERYLKALRPALFKVPRLSTLNVVMPPHFRGTGDHIIELLRGTQLPLKSIRGITFLLEANIATGLREFANLEDLRTDTIVWQETGRIATLTHLYITTPLDEEALTRLVKVYGSQLASLRITRALGQYDGRRFPGKVFPWEKMRKLRYLHIDDIGRSVTYLPGEQADLSEPYPVALETLIWTPTWARGRMMSEYAVAEGDTPRDRIISLRQFAKRALLTWPTLKTVLYEWQLNGMFQCWISSSKRGKEREASEEQKDPEAWARVE